MVEVRVEDELGVTPPEAWKVVGDFVGFLEAQGLPAEGEGEGVGMLRRFALGAETIVERLEQLDEDTFTTAYSIVSGPTPGTDYLATIRLTPASGDRTTLTWTSTFEPVGMSDDDAVAFMGGIYQAGIQALQKRFGASRRAPEASWGR